MELTIVLAVIAVIAAILLPAFLLTTDRARLRADIQSARVIQNAIDLYRVERGREVAGGSREIPQILLALENAGYINARNRNIQTAGAVWYNHATDGIMVDISGSSADVRRAFEGLPANEQLFVRDTAVRD